MFYAFEKGLLPRQAWNLENDIEWLRLNFVFAVVLQNGVNGMAKLSGYGIGCNSMVLPLCSLFLVVSLKNRISLLSNEGRLEKRFA